MLSYKMVKRVYKASRKPRGRTSGFKKAVSAIAKKAVMRSAETNTGLYQPSTTVGSSGAFIGTNGGGIISAITQGTAQANRIGDKIQFMGVKMRGYIAVDPTIYTALREFAGFRLLICTGKRPLTSGDMPSFKGAADPEVVTVLSDKYYKLSSTNFAVFLNRYIKFNRNVNFSGSVVVKNDLYVWIIPPPLGTGITTTTGYGATFDCQMYWKDL